MDRNQTIAVLLLFAALLAVGGSVVFLPHRRRPRQAPAPGAELPAADAESTDSVMRALTLVQHRYAALVRLYDETQTRLRDTEIERDHWKRQALDGKKH